MIKTGKFNVRIVRTGDRYGLRDCLTHDEKEPLVEFYDSRYPHTQHGQFISRYYVSTIVERKNQGLCLDGGVSEWALSATQMDTVKDWIQKELTK